MQDTLPADDALRPYVPRLLLEHLAQTPTERVREVDGSVVFVDISGFTKLSERLAKRGKEGAEQITEAIGSSFEAVLAVAYVNGGGLIKFGGDALLLLFEGEGHAARGAQAALGMRRVLRDVGRIDVPGAKVTLRMSVGMHTGRFHFLLVGGSHRELLPVGPGWTRTVEMEHAADAGQIVVSRQTADVLPARCVGEAKGPGCLLRREPGSVPPPAEVPRVEVPAGDIATCLSTAVRAHVMAGGGAPEHRPVTVAFIHFDGTDALIERSPAEAAEAMNDLVTIVQRAADQHEVCFLGSDVDSDGGKLILTAGAPKVTGDDEERMLFTARAIMEAEPVVPVRIGIHRGSVFAGDIGPWYRRTYTVMGDTVNLAARLMAKAGPGEIYATADVLDRSTTLFETTALEPFAVKGKAQPIQAWSIGAAMGSRAREATLERVPLIGRADELAVAMEALEAVRRGDGRLVEISGESGIGKTRLQEELRERSEGTLLLHATCEAFTASTPYIVWRELLRQLLDLGWEDPDQVVVERLYTEVSAHAPELTPWLPLIALAFDADMPPTPEVEDLPDEQRRPKLHESVAAFLEAILGEPALIEIEDVHNMDEASSELLAFLADGRDGHPWLFSLTRRTEGGGFTATPGPGTVRIELDPLPPQDAMAMAIAVTERQPLPDHLLPILAERSAGNPQFLRDLVRAAARSGSVDELPDSIEAATMARIDALQPEDRAVLRRAAVFGLTFRPDMLDWVAEEGEPAPAASTWVRLQEFFLDDGDGYLRFRRGLMRDAAYEGLPFRTRRRLHAVVGEQLEAGAAGAPEDLAQTLSLHFFLAGSYERAWRYGRLAGDDAQRKFAPAEAAAFYRRALESAERSETVSKEEIPEVVETLGECLIRSGQLEVASKTFNQALKYRVGDPLASARVLLRQAYVAERVGRPDLVVRRAGKAARLLESVPTQEARSVSASAVVSLAAARRFQGKMEEAVRLCERVIQEATESGNRTALAEAYNVLDWSLLELGRLDEATHLSDAVKIYEALGDRRSAATVFNSMGALAYFRGNWDEAVELYQRMVTIMEELGDPGVAAHGTLNIAEVLSDQGHLVDAEERLRRVLQIARGAKEESLVAYAAAYLGRVASRAGRFEEARAAFQEARTSFMAQRADRDLEQVASWEAECALFEGRWESALAWTDAMLGAEGASAALLERVRGVALFHLDNEEHARAAMDKSVEHADDEGSDYECALTLRARAELWPGEPDSSRARTDAEALFEGLGVISVPDTGRKPADQSL